MKLSVSHETRLIAALAALFTTCVVAINYVVYTKNTANHEEQLSTRFVSAKEYEAAQVASDRLVSSQISDIKISIAAIRDDVERNSTRLYDIAVKLGVQKP